MNMICTGFCSLGAVSLLPHLKGFHSVQRWKHIFNSHSLAMNLLTQSYFRHWICSNNRRISDISGNRYSLAVKAAGPKLVACLIKYL